MARDNMAVSAFSRLDGRFVKILYVLPMDVTHDFQGDTMCSLCNSDGQMLVEFDTVKLLEHGFDRCAVRQFLKMDLASHSI